MRTDQTTFSSIHQYFAWDHHRLDEILSEVLKIVDKGDLERAERTFDHYDRGMRRHIRVEEDIINQFYAFERTATARSPAPAMQTEHAHLLQLLDTMRESLSQKDLPSFRAAHAKLTAILPEHLAKEEVVYPALDSLLGAAEAERMVARLRAK